MHANQPASSTYDPHGYQALIVDEDCLSSEDCRQAIVEMIGKPRDWRSSLTPAELIQLETALQDSKKRQSPYFYCPGESAEMRDLKAVAARLGMYRAYARDKYSAGERFWYGDAPPWV